MKKVFLMTSVLAMMSQMSWAGGGFGPVPLPEIRQSEVQCHVQINNTGPIGEQVIGLSFNFGKGRDGKLGRVRMNLFEMQPIVDGINHGVVIDTFLDEKFNAITLSPVARTAHGGRVISVRAQGIQGLEGRIFVNDENLVLESRNQHSVLSPQLVTLTVQAAPAVFKVQGEELQAVCNLNGEGLQSLLRPNLGVDQLFR